MFDIDNLKKLISDIPGLSDSILEKLSEDLSVEPQILSSCDTESVETKLEELPCEKPITEEDRQKELDNILSNVPDIPIIDTWEQFCTNECISNLIGFIDKLNKENLEKSGKFDREFINSISSYLSNFQIFKFYYLSYFTYSVINNPSLIDSFDKSDIKEITESENSMTEYTKVFIDNLLGLIENNPKLNRQRYTELASLENSYKKFPNDINKNVSTALSVIDSRFTIENDKYGFFDISWSNYQNNTNGIVGDIRHIFKKEPNESEIKKGNYLENRKTDFIKLLTDYFSSDYFSSDTIYKFCYCVLYYGNIKKLKSKLGESKKNLILSFSELFDIISILDTEKQKNNIIDELKKLECCGKPLDIKNPDEQESIPVSDDLSNNSFNKKGNPELTDLKYWQKYALNLTALNLLPIYWTTGLVIMGAPLKLPTVWIALYCIKTPVNIIVLFLTINGIVVSPVIWILNMKPIADNQSMLLVLFRGGMKEIKTDTNCVPLNIQLIPISSPLSLLQFSKPDLPDIAIPNQKPTVPTIPLDTTIPEIDLNTMLSLVSLFKTDDLPTYERLLPINLPYVAYLDKWLTTAKPFMGLSI